MSDDPKIVTVKHVQGVEVPNIGALSETIKDWLYTGGLFHPPPKIDFSMATFNTAFTFAPFLSPYHTTFISPFAPPPPALPVEKREMPVVGYRAWKYSSKFALGHGRVTALGSTGVAGHWVPGINSATCGGRAIDNEHMTHCNCGFYVLGDLDQVEGHVGINDGIIVGAVQGWGLVVQHGTEGWRAQYARILALLDCKYSKGQLKNTQQAAEAYGVEVKSRNALEAIVREWGDPFAA